MSTIFYTVMKLYGFVSHKAKLLVYFKVI